MEFVAVYDSFKLADVLDLTHSAMLQRITEFKCSSRFKAESFRTIRYKDSKDKWQRFVVMNRGGLMYLLMKISAKGGYSHEVSMAKKCLQDLGRVIEEYSLIKGGKS